MEGINITIVAKEIGDKSRDLSEYINKRYQINFNTWINNYKIEFIKELLSNKNYNDKSLLEISELAGFNDLSAMSKTFKKIVGINPSTFRSSRD